jgi:hypothetical protein
MPTSAGPNMLGDSNLMFVYDTGDVANSYLGEPTTNLATFNIASSTFNTDAPGNLTQTANSSEATFQGRLSRKMVVGDGYWNAYVYGYNTGVSSTNFAISYKVKTSDNSHPSTVIGGGYIYGSAGTFFPSPTFTYLSDGWYLATILYSGTSMTLNSLTGMYGYGPKTFYIVDYQAEAKSNSTPFAGVSGTRSISGSLFDISGNRNTISLFCSYDSNAQPYFDATDDYFSLGSDVTFKTTGDWTVESVVYYNAVAGGYNNTTSPANFIGSETISYNSWYWSVLENKLALWNISPGYWRYGSTTLQANRWYHVTLVCYNAGYSYRFYLNGVPEGGDHVSQVWNPSYSGLAVRYIGKGNNANTRLVSGKIPITKMYNRVLSQDEIYNNYNEYKTRFNLT